MWKALYEVTIYDSEMEDTFTSKVLAGDVNRFVTAINENIQADAKRSGRDAYELRVVDSRLVSSELISSWDAELSRLANERRAVLNERL